MLSELTAKSLISEISSVIDYDINIMDEKGSIIASTDPDRIGQFHEAAWLIIDGNLPELIVHYDNEYEGCRKGTNLPIVADSEIIGVIGITGNVEDTVRYGNLIKKITEILMKDIINLQQKTRREQSRMLFVTEWLSGDIHQISEIKRRLHKYECRQTGTWQVALIKSISDKEITRSFILSQTDPAKVLTAWNNEFGTIIGTFPSSEKCSDYIKTIFNDTYRPDDFICTIGHTYESENDVPSSYDQALSSLRSLSSSKGCIVHYDDALLDIILNNIPDSQSSEFAAYVFSGCKLKDIPDILDFISAYRRCDGSIKAISQELYVHKNTVQYKINRLRESTGLDIRVLEDFIKLELARRWYK